MRTTNCYKISESKSNPKCKTSNEQCEVCIHAKLTKTLSRHVERINERLDLIYVT